jgi:hypothetical protein
MHGSLVILNAKRAREQMMEAGLTGCAQVVED